MIILNDFNCYYYFQFSLVGLIKGTKGSDSAFSYRQIRAGHWLVNDALLPIGVIFFWPGTFDQIILSTMSKPVDCVFTRQPVRVCLYGTSVKTSCVTSSIIYFGRSAPPRAGNNFFLMNSNNR